MQTDSSMRSRAVVVLGVRIEDALQVTPAKDEDVVETLSSSASDPALRERVRFRRTDRCPHNLEAFGPEDLIEGSTELRVSVTEQDMFVVEAFGDRQVPSLLGDPHGIGAAGLRRRCGLVSWRPR